mmetsp:Transcript_15699/g.38207  ORF Transcript_15699/g.38207 Transcript_15699/m.38207 type:complete len:300 (-) Transcript_15699:384-1283(-)
MVKLDELSADDGNGEGEEQQPRAHDNAPHRLPGGRLGHHIPIPSRSHARDDVVKRHKNTLKLALVSTPRRTRTPRLKRRARIHTWLRIPPRPKLRGPPTQAVCLIAKHAALRVVDRRRVQHAADGEEERQHAERLETARHRNGQSLQSLAILAQLKQAEDPHQADHTHESEIPAGVGQNNVEVPGENGDEVDDVEWVDCEAEACDDGGEAARASVGIERALRVCFCVDAEVGGGCNKAKRKLRGKHRDTHDFNRVPYVVVPPTAQRRHRLHHKAHTAGDDEPHHRKRPYEREGRRGGRL